MSVEGLRRNLSNARPLLSRTWTRTVGALVDVMWPRVQYGVLTLVSMLGEEAIVEGLGCVLHDSCTGSG
jgi:hypothetical protein